MENETRRQLQMLRPAQPRSRASATLVIARSVTRGWIIHCEGRRSSGYPLAAAVKISVADRFRTTPIATGQPPAKGRHS
jgi:hypothetical protein